MIRRTLALLVALLCAAPALAQPVNLPANTVWGRLGIGTGPGQAIPFATLTTNLLVPRVNVSDVNYPVAVGDTEVAYISISAARSVSLQPAGNYVRGQSICIRDVSGSASASNTVSAIPAGTDTINGVNATKVIVSGAYGGICLESDGATAWTLALIANAQFAAMPAYTAKCNNTAATATPIDCTVAQFKAFEKIAVSIEDPAFGASPSATAAANVTAIQAALTSITGSGVAGVLLVPGSNYNINAPIVVSGPVDIWCAPFLNASGGTFNGAQGGGVMFAFRSSYTRMTGCYLNRAGTPQAGDDAIVVGDDSGSIADAICTNGSGTVTSASAGFTGASIGQRIALTSCATAGATLFSTITAKASGSSITVSPVAGATPGAGVAAKYGTVYVENRFRDVWTVNHINGFHLIDAAQQHLDDVYSNSKVGALIENQLSADYGDSFISDSEFLSTDNTNGYALEIISSGGLKISNSKFLFGKYGIYINWNLGGSANPILTNNSIESFATTGVFINTAVTLTRLNITGGSIAGATGANAITVDNTSLAALTDINIIGVSMTGFGGVTNMIDVGKVSGGIISNLTIDNGGANTCVNLRSNSASVRVLMNYYNCSATPVADAGTANVTKVPVAEGGTGAATLTAHGILLGETTSAIVATAAMSDGQVLVGQTGADPLPKTLTGITVSAAGVVTVPAVTSVQCGGAAITATGSCPTPSIAARLGGFDVWQRLINGATTIAQAASLTAYVNDGWYLITNANQASTITQIAGIATGSQFAVKVQRNNGQTGTGVMRYAAPLFLDEIALLTGYNVAISFTALKSSGWTPSGSTLNYTVYCGTGTAAKRGSSAYTGETSVITGAATLTTSATRTTFTSPAIVPTNCTQMEIQFSATPVGTAGADDSFTVDDLNLEVVSASTITASPYPRWSYGDQLDRARSVFRILAGGVISSRIYVGLTESTSVMSIGGPLSPPMKSVPAPSFVGTAGNIHCNDLAVNSAFQGTFGATNYSTQYVYGFQLNCAATLTAGKAGFLNFDGSAAEALFLSSEL